MTQMKTLRVNIKLLEIEYVGEEAVDERGPLRELFSLVFEERE